jgi:NAD(P)-dependent dehydrogenase (short-subunit alcohol dehydrogenase family)
MVEESIKVALVTGASKGIGRGTAIELARNGWNVVVNYHSDADGADQTAGTIRQAGRQAWVMQADVGIAADVDLMFDRIRNEAHRLDLLVNNAAVQTWSPLLDLSEADWDRTIRTNLKGCFLCSQRAVRLMTQSGGSIINIGSGANKRPFPNLIDYASSKGAIERFTRVAAVELGKYKIRVNCVAPGAIEIERTRREAPDYAGTWAPLTPLGRVGDVRDVAAAVVFLASDQAEFITGQTLYVDGGLFTQGPWPYET